MTLRISICLILVATAATTLGATNSTNSTKSAKSAKSAKPAKPAKPEVAATYQTVGTIEVLDARFNSLVSPAAKVEVLASGFKWCEGPVWVPTGHYLLFSDIPNNVVNRWKDGEGVKTFLKPSGYTGRAPRGGEVGSNGLLLDRDGQLVLCEHGDRRVARLERDGHKTTLAEFCQYRRLNSPNDAAFKSNGDLYFTDPPYGLEKRDDDPARELLFSGIYRVSAGGGLQLLSRELKYPNGIAFSLDEKKLYVSNSDPNRPIWMAFPVQPDGTLTNGQVFFDAAALAKDRPGMPDGMKLDNKGNLFATGPGGVLVLSPQGKHLGTILTGDLTSNCAWGDDGSVLYLTRNSTLCRINTLTKGRGL